MTTSNNRNGLNTTRRGISRRQRRSSFWSAFCADVTGVVNNATQLSISLFSSFGGGAIWGWVKSSLGWAIAALGVTFTVVVLLFAICHCIKRLRAEAEPSPKINAGKGETVKIAGVDYQFRFCPPETFEMGRHVGEGNDEDTAGNETLHMVTLSKCFWVLETPVAQSLWKSVMRNNPSLKKDDDCPVESVSWMDCQVFIQKANKLLRLKKDSLVPKGVKLRLPTEAEWEYFCRADSKKKCQGKAVLDDRSPRSVKRKDRITNSWKIADALGNVWEWCADGPVQYTADPQKDPVGPVDVSERVVRGGSWRSKANDIQPSLRESRSKDGRYDDVGFRLVLSSEPFSARLIGWLHRRLKIVCPVAIIAAIAAGYAAYKHAQSVGPTIGKSKVIAISGVDYKFMYCPPGNFLMGSPASEEYRFEDEEQHNVTLSHEFWMLESETTQRLWNSIMGYNPSVFQGDDLPVENISWEECQIFLEKLNNLNVAPENMKFRLPTEAEWEYACRAGTNGPYSVKAGKLDKVAWYGNNSADNDGSLPLQKDIDNNLRSAKLRGDVEAEKLTDVTLQEYQKLLVIKFTWPFYRWHMIERDGNYLGRPRSVKRKKPNAWGLYDMHGNVSEWCFDCKGEYVGSKRDPAGPPDGLTRAVRGGGWADLFYDCRSASRNFLEQMEGRIDLGFRIVLSSYDPKPDLTVNKKTEDASLTTPTEEPKPGTVKSVKIAGVDYNFCYCPAGNFMMGSPGDEPDREDDEEQHRVTLSRGFWMLETEVTQRLWTAVMGDNPSLCQVDKQSSVFDRVRSFPIEPNTGEDYPVENVSWHMCRMFVSKLNDRGYVPGMEFGLPTEAQWEYACRAGSTGPYAGNLDEMAWYGKKNFFTGGRTRPVKMKKSNAWGLYDMHGNVGEWCSDWYDRYSGEAETDPRGPASATLRVARGGGVDSDAHQCRSAERDAATPSIRNFNLGLRLTLSSSK